MTTNPQTLRDLGALWTSMGGVNLGVVGDSAHAGRPSYHNGKDRIVAAGNLATDYSCQHPRDKAGLSNAASAIDLGKKDGTLAGLYEFSEWLVGRCRMSAVGTEDIREVIYWSAANQRVQRWNFDNVIRWGAGQGDLSHKTHTHISYFRDSEFRDKRPLFAAYGLPDTGTEETVEAFSVFETPHLVNVKLGAWLYWYSDLRADARNVQLANRTPEQLALPYVGTFKAGEVAIIAYEPVAGDTNVSSRAMFVKVADLVGAPVAVPAPPPPPDPIPAFRERAAEAAAAAVRAQT